MLKFENHCSIELLISDTGPLLVTNSSKIRFAVYSPKVKELESGQVSFDYNLKRNVLDIRRWGGGN